MDYIKDVEDDFIMEDGTLVPIRVRGRKEILDTYYDYFVNHFGDSKDTFAVLNSVAMLAGIGLTFMIATIVTGVQAAQGFFYHTHRVAPKCLCLDTVCLQISCRNDGRGQRACRKNS